MTPTRSAPDDAVTQAVERLECVTILQYTSRGAYLGNKHSVQSDMATVLQSLRDVLEERDRLDAMLDRSNAAREQVIEERDALKAENRLLKGEIVQAQIRRSSPR